MSCPSFQAVERLKIFNYDVYLIKIDSQKNCMESGIYYLLNYNFLTKKILI